MRPRPLPPGQPLAHERETERSGITSKQSWRVGPHGRKVSPAEPCVNDQQEPPFGTRKTGLWPSIGRRETRQVDKLSTVRFASARYSVPKEHVGQQVTLQAGAGRLSMFVPVTGQVVADHPLLAAGESSILDERYGGARPLAPARKVRPRKPAEVAFCALGPVAEQWLKGAAAGNTRLSVELEEFAALEAAHGREPLIAVLRRAVAFGRWWAADVRSILAAGSGVAHPTPAGQALDLELSVTASRSLAVLPAGTGR